MRYELKAKIETLKLDCGRASIFYKDYEGDGRWLHMTIQGWKKMGAPLIDEEIFITVSKVQSSNQR